MTADLDLAGLREKAEKAADTELDWYSFRDEELTPQTVLALLDAHDAAVRERDAAVREVEELRAVVAEVFELANNYAMIEDSQIFRALDGGAE